MTTPLICGMVKVRNEIIRDGNVYRCLTNLKKFCDVIVACDDASVDGTRQILQQEIGTENLILVPMGENDFRQELLWKQRMLALIHEKIQPSWIWWADADEELDADGVKSIRAFATEALDRPEIAWRFRYTQLWRTSDWARTDDGFDAGSFIKLWKWSPDLAFDTKEGTHHAQVPKQIMRNLRMVSEAEWRVIHWGNVGKSLTWKCIQYWGGLGGVERHLSFEGASYRRIAPEGCSIATLESGSTIAIPKDWIADPPTMPAPFT